MRKVALLGLIILGLQTPAQASVQDWRVWQWTKNTVAYVWQPVNCPIDYVNKNIAPHTSDKGDLWDLGACVVDNVNRNPATLNELVN